MVYFWMFGSAFAGLMWGISIGLAGKPVEWWAEEGWTALSALGTVGSTVMAVWFATRDQRRLRTAEARRARIASSAVLAQVETAKGVAEFYRSSWSDNDRTFLESSGRACAQNDLIVAVRAFNLDQIDEISAVDETCSLHIINGQSSLQVTAKALEYDIDSDSLEQCDRALKKACEEFELAINRLKGAQQWR